MCGTGTQGGCLQLLSVLQGIGEQTMGAVLDGLLVRDLQVAPVSQHAHFLQPLPSKTAQLAAYSTRFRRRLLRLNEIPSFQKRCAAFVSGMVQSQALPAAPAANSAQPAAQSARALVAAVRQQCDCAPLRMKRRGAAAGGLTACTLACGALSRVHRGRAGPAAASLHATS